jgi:hypothetical protein
MIRTLPTEHVGAVSAWKIENAGHGFGGENLR